MENMDQREEPADALERALWLALAAAELRLQTASPTLHSERLMRVAAEYSQRSARALDAVCAMSSAALTLRVLQSAGEVPLQLPSYTYSFHGEDTAALMSLTLAFESDREAILGGGWLLESQAADMASEIRSIWIRRGARASADDWLGVWDWRGVAQWTPAETATSE